MAEKSKKSKKRTVTVLILIAILTILILLLLAGCAACGTQEGIESPVVDPTIATTAAESTHTEPTPAQPSALARGMLIFDDKAKRTSYSTEQQVWEENGVKVDNEKAESTTNVGDFANPARFNKDSKVTVTGNGGKVTKIVIDSDDTEMYLTALISAKFSAGSVTADGEIITVAFATPVDSLVITMNAGQARFDSITLYYESGAVAPEPTEAPTEEPTEAATEPEATKPADSGNAAPEQKPTEPAPTEAPEQKPTEPAPTAPPATEPPATEPVPTAPPATEPAPTNPPATEPAAPVGCQHSWNSVYHEEVGHKEDHVTCSCGARFGSSYDWIAHRRSYPQQEAFQNHGSNSAGSHWVVDVPAYTEWICSKCGAVSATQP